MNNLNYPQKLILVIAALIATYIALYPPFIYERTTSSGYEFSMSAGSAFVYMPPRARDLGFKGLNANTLRAKVDVPLLFTQLVFLIFIALTLILSLGSKKDREDHDQTNT